MLEKLKALAATVASFFASAKRYIVEIMAVVIGLLIYYINLKGKENRALQARIQMAQTQKQADLIEADVNEKLQNKDLLQKQVADLQQSLVSLQQRRDEIAKVEAGKTPEQIADYWKNN